MTAAIACVSKSHASLFRQRYDEHPFFIELNVNVLVINFIVILSWSAIMMMRRFSRFIVNALCCNSRCTLWGGGRVVDI